MTDTKTITVTIATLAQAVGPKGKYYVLTTVPRPGRQYGDKYTLTLDQAQGLEAGAVVTLQLKQGRLKEGKSGEAEWDYWWDVVTVSKGEVAEKGEAPKPELSVAPGTGIKIPEGKPEPLPWHRFIAWGEVVEQALKMVAATLSLGEGEVAPENQQAEYAKRFEWAMETICAAIRKQMKEG